MSEFVGRVAVTAGVLAMLAVAAPPAGAEPADNLRPGQVVLVAGTDEPGYSGDGWAATDARIGDVVTLTVAQNGTVYLADLFQNRVRVVTTDGKINTLPGTGPGTVGGVASATTIGPDGALYIAGYDMVGRWQPDGSITVLGGGGDESFKDGGDGGDGGPATDARLGLLHDIAIDAAGNIYVSDSSFNRIRKITPDGTITTVAGGGTLAPKQGEGVPATRLSLTNADETTSPGSLAVDSAGNLYFTLWLQSLVGKIAPDGTYHRVAGTEDNVRGGFAGDGGPAGQALLGDKIGGIDIDGEDNLYVLDAGLIRMITPDGTISTVGLATGGDDLALGPDGDIYMSGRGEVHRLVRHGETPEDRQQPVRRDPRWTGQAPGTVVTVAGNGYAPPGGAGTGPNWADQTHGPAPIALTVGADGAVYVADPDLGEVRKVAKDGKVTVVPGTGVAAPSGVAVGPDGAIYVADYNDDDDGRVRKVSAGGGTTDVDVPADQIAVDAAGNLIAVDVSDRLVRRVDPTGAVSTIAGGGKEFGKDADGHPAVDAFLSQPELLALGADGTVYFADGYRDVVKAVGPDGILRVVAGGGDLDEGFAGDGGPARTAMINRPSGLAAGPDGSLYLADTYNNRIRRITPDGVITTIAGTGEPAENGDGGPAAKAALLDPVGLTVDRAGNVYIAGRSGSLRRIDAAGTITTIAKLWDTRVKATTAIQEPLDIATDRAGTLYLASTSATFAVTQNGMRELVDDVGGGPLATGGDGSLYSAGVGLIERRCPDGAVVTLGGRGPQQAPFKRGQPVMTAVLEAYDIAAGPDGALYLADRHAVYRLGQDGTLQTVVERSATGIAIGPDGSLYLAEKDRHLVQRFRNGTLTNVAGTGSSSYYSTEDDDGQGSQATATVVSEPEDVAVARDGTVYVSAADGISRVRPDGTINTILPTAEDSAGNSYAPADLALDPHGNLYFAEPDAFRVRVLVRPGEMDFSTFGWRTMWLGLNVAVAVCVGAVVFFAYRRRLVELVTGWLDARHPPREWLLDR